MEPSEFQEVLKAYGGSLGSDSEGFQPYYDLKWIEEGANG